MRHIKAWIACEAYDGDDRVAGKCAEHATHGIVFENGATIPVCLRHAGDFNFIATFFNMPHIWTITKFE